MSFPVLGSTAIRLVSVYANPSSSTPSISTVLDIICPSAFLATAICLGADASGITLPSSPTRTAFPPDVIVSVVVDVELVCVVVPPSLVCVFVVVVCGTPF